MYRYLDVVSGHNLKRDIWCTIWAKITKGNTFIHLVLLTTKTPVNFQYCCCCVLGCLLYTDFHEILRVCLKSRVQKLNCEYEINVAIMDFLRWTDLSVVRQSEALNIFGLVLTFNYWDPVFSEGKKLGKCIFKIWYYSLGIAIAVDKTFIEHPKMPTIRWFKLLIISWKSRLVNNGFVLWKKYPSPFHVDFYFGYTWTVGYVREGCERACLVLWSTTAL